LKSRIDRNLKFPYRIILSNHYNKKYIIKDSKDEKRKLNRYYPELFSDNV